MIERLYVIEVKRMKYLCILLNLTAAFTTQIIFNIALTQVENTTFLALLFFQSIYRFDTEHILVSYA